MILLCRLAPTRVAVERTEYGPPLIQRRNISWAGRGRCAAGMSAYHCAHRWIGTWDQPKNGPNAQATSHQAPSLSAQSPLGGLRRALLVPCAVRFLGSTATIHARRWYGAEANRGRDRS